MCRTGTPRRIATAAIRQSTWRADGDTLAPAGAVHRGRVEPVDACGDRFVVLFAEQAQDPVLEPPPGAGHDLEDHGVGHDDLAGADRLPDAGR